LDFEMLILLPFDAIMLKNILPKLLKCS
jgi:hypothetical protein